MDFSKNPRSNPPLLEGRLDLLKGRRSTPPLLEGPLEISNRPRSMGGGSKKKGAGVLKYKVTLVKGRERDLAREIAAKSNDVLDTYGFNFDFCTLSTHASQLATSTGKDQSILSTSW